MNTYVRFWVRNYAAVSLILATLMLYVPIIFCKKIHYSLALMAFISFCFYFILLSFPES